MIFHQRGPEITSASFTFTQIYDYSPAGDSTLYVNLLNDELAEGEPAIPTYPYYSYHKNPINMDQTFEDVDGLNDSDWRSLNRTSYSGNEFQNYGEALITATNIPHQIYPQWTIGNTH